MDNLPAPTEASIRDWISFFEAYPDHMAQQFIRLRVGAELSPARIEALKRLKDIYDGKC